ncbi:hypothetical protein [Catenulispora subtropica]|uniref:Cupin domain-containing protein n=1 Tax=Catenulispora subtropica TaxID=450798 RepID=A0ABN2SW22_9ACTN
MALTVVQEAHPPFIPVGAHAMTIVIEYPPGDPGTPPHRHYGPAFIHYQDGNSRDDVPVRFVVTMLCEPDQPMLVLVDDEELEARRDRRAPRAN